MNDQSSPFPEMPDPVEFSKSMAGIAERSQRLVSDFLSRQASDNEIPDADPLNVGDAFLEMTTQMISNPMPLVEANINLWQDYLGLWQNAAQRMIGGDAAPVIEPTEDDRRFKDDAWADNGIFDYIKQSYLLTSQWLLSSVGGVEGLDAKSAQKVDFMTRQFVDAMSPSNFVMTNPEVLRVTFESGGENLIKGLENLLGDLEAGGGKLKINMSDDAAFKLGETIATAPGKVVFRNDLMELLQFDPTTDKVQKLPLVIVPPWINKYYILDLREKNSFIRWAVGEGHTVFVVSWVNPDADLAQKTFDDYLLEGPVAAIDAACQATGAAAVNLIGYCIGGTLSAATLAYLTARGEENRVNSATYFASMIDFANPGDLGVFIDEAQVESLEATMNERGYLDGGEMSSTFNMLRANDLIWSFVIHNYLMGKDPFPFDLLYWNADSTRMPAAMHSFYLRKMYLENKLVEPGGISLAGESIDLHKIKTPSYIVATKEDHIAPWKSAFAGVQTYAGPVRFVLAGSGHIAGIINPATSGRYGYWSNGKTPKTPEKWLQAATEHQGSWWPDWSDWIKKGSPKTQVPVRVPGDGKLKVLGDAPGTYVMVKTAT